MIGFPKQKQKKHKKRKDYTDISPKVKKIVAERDDNLCVVCRMKRGIPNMHYIARSHGGLGIEQNIVCGCVECHHDYDNGKGVIEYREIIKNYLKGYYGDNWDEQDLVYRKEHK